jgi:hypothetical protein
VQHRSGPALLREGMPAVEWASPHVIGPTSPDPQRVVPLLESAVSAPKYEDRAAHTSSLALVSFVLLEVERGRRPIILRRSRGLSRDSLGHAGTRCTPRQERPLRPPLQPSRVASRTASGAGRALGFRLLVFGNRHDELERLLALLAQELVARHLRTPLCQACPTSGDGMLRLGVRRGQHVKRTACKRAAAG